MASVYRRGAKWWIRYWSGGQEFRESAGPSKRDGERALMARLVEITEGKFFDPRRRCKVTFGEFIPRYLEWARGRKRSWKRDELSLRHLREHFGAVNLERLTLEAVEKYRRARLGGVLVFDPRGASASTVNRELACLRKLLNLAVDLSVLAENPLAGKLKLAKEPEGRCRYLEPGEMARLLDACAEHLRPVVHLAALTGMRRGELLGLRWPEVDLARGVIHLAGERTKNGRPRAVPLSPEARRILLSRSKVKAEGCELVFHRAGRPLGSIRTAFEKACRRAGIEDFCFHDLRHSFASGLAMRGVPLQAVGELLGHRTLSMTQRYAHLSPQALQRAVNEAADYFAGRELEGVARLPRGAAEAQEEVSQDAHTGHKTGTAEGDAEVIPFLGQGTAKG